MFRFTLRRMLVVVALVCVLLASVRIKYRGTIGLYDGVSLTKPCYYDLHDVCIGGWHLVEFWCNGSEDPKALDYRNTRRRFALAGTMRMQAGYDMPIWGYRAWAYRMFGVDYGPYEHQLEFGWHVAPEGLIGGPVNP